MFGFVMLLKILICYIRSINFIVSLCNSINIFFLSIMYPLRATAYIINSKSINSAKLFLLYYFSSKLMLINLNNYFIVKKFK